MTACIEEDGSLRAKVTFAPYLEDLRGKPLVVSYGQDEMSLPIFRTEISGREIEMNLPSFGQLTGLPAGDLESTLFSILIGPLSQAEGIWRINADVLGTSFDERFQLELVEGPRIEEHLIVNVLVPSEAIAKYPGGMLQIDIQLGPDLRQRLGEWPLSDWANGSRRLVIPCPGIKESFRAFDCMLMTQIRP
jgi:hypothetical protein